MSKTIAVAGKGGTGKTTIAALLAQLLSSRGTVLAMDADPSVNLHMALGLDTPETIGDIREEMLPSARGGGVPAGMNRYDYMAFRSHEALVESTGVDLLAMGRPEGPGCYCAANHVLRTAIDRMANAYDYVVIDNEAGMEHISRQTTRDVDILLLVSDPTVRGVTAAVRTQELVGELKVNVGAIHLVVNRANGALLPEIEEVIRSGGLRLIATIPADEGVGEFDARGRPLVDLPSSSPVRQAVGRLARQLGLMDPEGSSEAALAPAPTGGGHGNT